MDEDGDSSDGEGGRIAIIQRQAKRRLLNLRHLPRESVATLPEYTSSPPAESSGTEAMVARTTDAPPRYPQLTAEEADEERDEVGDVMRRVRVRRRRSMSGSSSDPYLDSLLARSVHALELSNALLQSSMTTQTSLSTLLSHEVDRSFDRSLDSHARFLTSQIHASDARRAWVDEIVRQVDSLEYGYPPPSPSSSGLSQSVPDAPNTFYERMRVARAGADDPSAQPSRREGLQHGQRPRSPPPRCTTQYINAEVNVPEGAESALLANGLRAAARIHALVGQDHSRKSSVEWSDSAPGSPRPAPSASTFYSHRRGNVSSPHVLQQTSQGQYASHQSHTPVRPLLSAVPAEPSTPAYQMLSAIALRTPPTASDAFGATRSDLGPRFAGEVGVPRFVNDLGPHAEVGRGRGGSVAGGSGLRRTRSATPSSRGGFVTAPITSPSKLRGSSTGTNTNTSSPSKPATRAVGTLSPGRSKPPTRTSSRTASSASVNSSNSPAAAGPSQPSPKHFRHPYLSPARPRQTQTSDPRSDVESDSGYKSAHVLRKILDASKLQHEPLEEGEEERGRETTAKGKQPVRPRVRMPTWSMITPTASTVKVETFTPEGVVSIEGMTGENKSVGGKTKSAIESKVTPDLLELPGEHPRGQRLLRSKSAGPSSRLGSLLPKVSLSGGGSAEPGPAVKDDTDRLESRSDETARLRPRLDRIDTRVADGLPRNQEMGPSGIDGLPTSSGLRIELNGAILDTDAGLSDSRVSLNSESESGESSQPSHASLPLPPRIFDRIMPYDRPSSLRLPGSPRASSLRQAGSGSSTPRSVTFSPLPPKHVSSGSRPLSEAKARRRKTAKEKEKPSWFASWFGPLPSPAGSSIKSPGYGVASRRGWDSPRSMDDWQI